MTLEEVQTNYKLVFRKSPPARYKNDQKWLQGKIDDELKNVHKEVVTDKYKKDVIDRGHAIIKGETVEIYNENNGFVRAYTKQEHGDEYVSLAENFCKKRKYVMPT